MLVDGFRLNIMRTFRSANVHMYCMYLWSFHYWVALSSSVKPNTGSMQHWTMQVMSDDGGTMM